jgi:hypothetical protein
MVDISLNKRSGQGGPLSNAEVDANWTTIENAFAGLAVAGSGTVTSVGLSTTQTSILTVGSSPVTTSGTITINFANQTANTIFAGPTTGSAAAPTFRAIVIADLPTITTAKGGTGLTSIGTGYQLLRTNSGATGLEYATITNGSSKVSVTNGANISIDIVENQISRANLIGTTPINGGGTGATTAQTARLALLPAVASNAGKFLKVNAGETDVEWATVTGAIPTINSLSGALTIAAGSTGTDFAIASVGTTITINIPSASATNRGLVTTGAQTIAGVKTFTSAPVVNTSTPAQVFYSGATREVAGSNDFTYDELNLKVGNVRQTSWTRVATSSTLEAATQSGILLDIGAAINLTLPTLDADIIGHKFVIKDMNGSCGTDHVTLRVQTGEILENTVNGTYLMNKAYECISVVAIDEGSSNFRWIILSEFS